MLRLGILPSFWRGKLNDSCIKKNRAMLIIRVTKAEVCATGDPR